MAGSRWAVRPCRVRIEYRTNRRKGSEYHEGTGRGCYVGAIKVYLIDSIFTVSRLFSSFKMFEPHMDDYLDDELDEVKRAFEDICKEWERSLARLAGGEVSACSVSSLTL